MLVLGALLPEQAAEIVVHRFEAALSDMHFGVAAGIIVSCEARSHPDGGSRFPAGGVARRWGCSWSRRAARAGARGGDNHALPPHEEARRGFHVAHKICDNFL